MNVLGGYVNLIETWGSDERIIEAARMSTNKGFEGWGPFDCDDCDGGYQSINGPDGEDEIECETCKGTGRVEGDEKLLRYLWTHKHATPFEMAGMVIEVEAPIMVFREWHRHRTQSYNEMSARYTPLPDKNYIPTPERCLIVAGKNKQERAFTDVELTHEGVLNWLEYLERTYIAAEECYQEGLRIGIPKELARLPVPVGRYSRMRASANLRNWLSFLTLRMDKAAQWEIRQFANAVGELIQEAYPRTWELFAKA